MQGSIIQFPFAKYLYGEQQRRESKAKKTMRTTLKGNLVTPYANGAAQYEFRVNDSSCTCTVKKQRKKRTSPQRAAVVRMLLSLEQQMQDYLSGHFCQQSNDATVCARVSITLVDILNND